MDSLQKLNIGAIYNPSEHHPNHNMTLLPVCSSFLSRVSSSVLAMPSVPSVVSTERLGEWVTTSIGNMGNGFNGFGGGMEVQHVLDSHFLMYSLRQTMYGLILNQGNLFKEILDGFRNMTVTEIVYYAVFLSATYWCWKDMAYKKSTQKIKETQAISPKTVKRIETFLFIVVMILFQDVDNATG